MSRFTDVSVDPSLTRRIVIIAFAFAPFYFQKSSFFGTVL